MINYDNYKTVKLKEIATWERAQAGKIYPAGCTTIQISATRGQHEYLDEPREVHTKEVVVQPDTSINPRYFFIVISKNMDRYLSSHQTGLNIKEKEIGEFPIELHDKETQAAIVQVFDWLDSEIKDTELAESKTDDLKKTLMTHMFV